MSDKNTFTFNDVSPTKEYLDSTLNALDYEKALSPSQIAKITGLSLNATHKSLIRLEGRNEVVITRSSKTPTMLVKRKRQLR